MTGAEATKTVMDALRWRREHPREWRVYMDFAGRELACRRKVSCAELAEATYHACGEVIGRAVSTALGRLAVAERPELSAAISMSTNRALDAAVADICGVGVSRREW